MTGGGEAACWVPRTGSPWRDLPSRHGPSTTVDKRDDGRAERGVWLAIFEALARREPAA
ncbi:transposase [Acuticoccus sp.]|uniref:transposase n=1 Tax=Acuticoccus sp. TaxID=1904378 RepID=UPI003B5196EE